ncbi:hypothetical protein SPAB_03662 [Salmonella enterica subsp. enterica serovar Paratyphi B str. SPB7]|nr:hypothetical protein SPAB_03662 [Salmonella enterica subsp. enterica serovar Paratyphi B str. SPB7]
MKNKRLRRNGGLSPLARETQGKINNGESESRFIPAGAGNTLNVYHCL